MQFYHRNKRDTWGNKRMRVDQKRLGGGGSTNPLPGLNPYDFWTPPRRQQITQHF